MTIHLDTKLDSKEGIAAVIEAAKAGGLVLNECHERLAIKYGVPMEGVTFSRPLPTYHLPVYFAPK